MSALRVSKMIRPLVWLALFSLWGAVLEPWNAVHCQIARGSDQASIGRLLEDRCIRCHKPGNAQGEVDLTRPWLYGSMKLIRKDAPAGSLLIEVTTASQDEVARMPQEGKKLSVAEIEMLRKWVEAGAVWPEDLALRERSKADTSWWAFQPLRSTEELNSLLETSLNGIPTQTSRFQSGSSKFSAPANRIDSWISQARLSKGLPESPPADRRTWLRRITYAMHGLPPTREEIDAFENDIRPDAVERIVDRLLASPRYGEQWGRHWLDVVRFGESNGYERNVIIDSLWPFRDYVIESWNDDKPYDELMLEHLAGDVLGPGNPSRETGVAFLVCGPYDDVGNQDPVQAANIRANTIDDVIRATSESFLGLTVGCARCHDHKFDPILQRDYYALYGTFAGVRHGSRVLATAEQQKERAEKLAPLEAQLSQLRKEEQEVEKAILARAENRAKEISDTWTRPAVDRYATVEEFKPVLAKFVRLKVLNRQDNPSQWRGFLLDEFEVWSSDQSTDVERGQLSQSSSRNVALAANGGVARGGSRVAEDFKDAYGVELVNDGKFGERWIANAPELTIELANPTWVERVLFSSDRPRSLPQNSGISQFLGDYSLEYSLDGEAWTTLADSTNRQPPSDAHRRARLLAAETRPEEVAQQDSLRKQIASVNKQIQSIPSLPSVWIGNFEKAAGPFPVFLGGDPQRKGDEVVIQSLSAWEGSSAKYALPATAEERERRDALGRWLANPANPLPSRVIANRVWQWNFGTGIVDTPSDFGYLGGKPTHPELLDELAKRLINSGWSLKTLQRDIVLSNAYRQSSQHHPDAARIDAESRYLWRFPPRRMTAEEVRDTMLSVSGNLDLHAGGPGFRLYRFIQDNVSTYIPLDEHPASTWRRAVYHQNVRAQFVDVMSDFDCPDPAGAVPRRAATTTPLQALTLLNHDFTFQIANSWAARLESQSADSPKRLHEAFEMAFGRRPTRDEQMESSEFILEHGWPAWCRAILNSSELIFIE